LDEGNKIRVRNFDGLSGEEELGKAIHFAVHLHMNTDASDDE
jgi:hypothetical protein